eukprot:6209210-Pleurochrysis_carterae.AAC.1
MLHLKVARIRKSRTHSFVILWRPGDPQISGARRGGCSSRIPSLEVAYPPGVVAPPRQRRHSPRPLLPYGSHAGQQALPAAPVRVLVLCCVDSLLAELKRSLLASLCHHALRLQPCG